MFGIVRKVYAPFFIFFIGPLPWFARTDAAERRFLLVARSVESVVVVCCSSFVDLLTLLGRLLLLSLRRRSRPLRRCCEKGIIWFCRELSCCEPNRRDPDLGLKL